MVPKLSLRHRDYVSPFGSHAYLCCSKTFLVSMKTNFKHNFHTFATIIKKVLKKICSCDENLLSTNDTKRARNLSYEIKKIPLYNLGNPLTAYGTKRRKEKIN